MKKVMIKITKRINEEKEILEQEATIDSNEFGFTCSYFDNDVEVKLLLKDEVINITSGNNFFVFKEDYSHVCENEDFSFLIKTTLLKKSKNFLEWEYNTYLNEQLLSNNKYRIDFEEEVI